MNYKFNIGDIISPVFQPDFSIKIISRKFDYIDKNLYLCEDIDDLEREWIKEDVLTGDEIKKYPGFNIGDLLEYYDDDDEYFYSYDVVVVNKKIKDGNYTYLCEFDDGSRKWLPASLNLIKKVKECTL